MDVYYKSDIEEVSNGLSVPERVVLKLTGILDYEITKLPSVELDGKTNLEKLLTDLKGNTKQKRRVLTSCVGLFKRTAFSNILFDSSNINNDGDIVFANGVVRFFWHYALLKFLGKKRKQTSVFGYLADSFDETMPRWIQSIYENQFLGRIEIGDNGASRIMSLDVKNKIYSHTPRLRFGSLLKLVGNTALKGKYPKTSDYSSAIRQIIKNDSNEKAKKRFINNYDLNESSPITEKTPKELIRFVTGF